MRLATTVFSVALAVLLASVAPGCGGKTSEDEDDGSTPAEPSAPNTPPDSGSSREPGGTALGPCTLGFYPDDFDAARCDWMAEGRCYASKLAACACVCPRNKKDSSCVSGFFVENGRTEVTCF